MIRTTLSASLLAAALLATTVPATAADLDYGRYPSGKYSAYEDPRYADIYGHPPAPRYAPPPYADYRRTGPVPPVPPAYVYRENERHRYRDLPRDHWRGQDACLPREEIRRQLISEGWRDFHDLELRGEVARINARRPNGDLYALKVDRCSGEIVNSHFLERGDHRPYAYDNGGRWNRPYY